MSLLRVCTFAITHIKFRKLENSEASLFIKMSDLKNFSCDKLLTHFALYPKLVLIVPFTVGDAIPERQQTLQTSTHLYNQKFNVSGKTIHQREVREKSERGGIYLLIYSPLSAFRQVLHLKHPMCHRPPSANRAWPFLMSRPHPLQSETTHMHRQ